MAAEYQVHVMSPSGSLQAVVTNPASIGYVRRVNAPGRLEFTIAGDHPAISSLVDKSQIEVWRRDRANGVDWYCDFYGLFRDSIERGLRPGSFTAQCIGQLSMLAWRSVLFPSGTANRSQFSNVAAETIAKRLVQYNATADATLANGRLRDGAITGISIEADGGSGNLLTDSFAYENLLAALQSIAIDGGGDFDLIKIGEQSWEFRWYHIRRGIDRSDSVAFSTTFDNLIDPRLERVRSHEATVALVAGSGEGSSRTTAVVMSEGYSGMNDIEIFVDARDIKSSDGLTTRGETRLKEREPRINLSFDVAQVPAAIYGRDYFLGDLVAVQYRDYSANHKITGVAIEITSEGERIKIETEVE